MIEFKKGDKAYLITGSPEFTVVDIKGSEILVTWINRRENVRREYWFENWQLTDNDFWYRPGRRWDNPFKVSKDLWFCDVCGDNAEYIDHVDDPIAIACSEPGVDTMIEVKKCSKCLEDEES